MVVYYRGPTARITDQVIETWCPDYRSFAIADLWEVRIGRTAPGPVDLRSTGIAVGLLTVGAASLACLPASGGCALMTIFAAGAAIAGMHAARPRRPLYVITAWHQGSYTCLYACTDERVFGQVRRGLTRALEAYEDG
jgi:hypothetical protein